MAEPRPAAAAGGAAPAAGAEGLQPPPRPGALNIVLQLALMYIAYQYFRGGASAASKQAPANATLETLQPALVTASAATTPSSAPGLFDMLDPNKMKRKVLPELQQYENARLAALGAVSRDVALVNLWAPSTPFELLVFLSPSADPLTDFRVAEDAWAATAAEGGNDVEAGAPSADASASSSSFIMRLATERGGVGSLIGEPTYTEGRNLTFTGLPGAFPPEDATNANPAGATTGVLAWYAPGLSFDWSESNYVRQHLEVVVPPAVYARNASVWAHVFLHARSGGSAGPPATVDAVPAAAKRAAVRRLQAAWSDASAPGYSPTSVIHIVHPLVTFLKKKPHKPVVSLLGDDGAGAGGGMPKPTAAPSETPAPTPDASASPAPLLPFWRPSVWINTVVDHSRYSTRGLPPHVANALVVPFSPDTAAPIPGYLPVALVNDFWVLKHHLVPLNDTQHTYPLTLSFAPQSSWKWGLQAQMTTTWDMQASFMGPASGGDAEDASADTDMIKTLLTDSNPLLLIITMLVSTAHTVLDFFAFKSDVSHFRGLKSAEGLSVKSIALNVIIQAIIALYLFENDTSWMVLGSTVVGLAIEVWKLRKAVAINLRWRGWVPTLSLDDKEGEDGGSGGYSSTSKTREYDDIAMSHMVKAMLPLLLGYAVYSLVYEKHKSWYSFILTSLVGFVYAWGFAAMVPQLYVNYKLRSVAAMPMRAMAYKFCGTIIDDLFAFLIKMPTLHRIAVFRDDVIFILFLIQRWKYPVDPNRVNEYGASGADYQKAEARKRGMRLPLRGKLDTRAADGSIVKAAPQ